MENKTYIRSRALQITQLPVKLSTFFYKQPPSYMLTFSLCQCCQILWCQHDILTLNWTKNACECSGRYMKISEAKFLTIMHLQMQSLKQLAFKYICIYTYIQISVIIEWNTIKTTTTTKASKCRGNYVFRGQKFQEKYSWWWAQLNF